MNASLLPQVIVTLQQHPEQDRIKKLIHWVCEQDWPHSAADARNVEVLLPQLLAHSQNAAKHEIPAEMGQAHTDNFPAALQSILIEGASQLSKRQKYTEVALSICQVLAQLYSDNNSSDRCKIEESAVDVFELRLAVIKYTTPLNAKILIYSALHQVITGQRQDWISLRQVSLDELLLDVRQTYPTFAGLEERLWQTVDSVQLLDQPTQTLQAVLQAVRPIYNQSGATGEAHVAISYSVEADSITPPWPLEEEDHTMLRPARKDRVEQTVKTPGAS
ncbi:hypothetical protein C1752_01018 [Acaryochloris thomasi RCC1774]|uniref:Uncharacterized protein n=1 Tax=Acaryochloris thomasi RCC1774 TaxID=1764569 RepID=A0A2W1JX21_9CYAN|nr:hypothetical protein [Acaryochloris thomasi]PZD74692.1 hypothetical protein C1752_01018 [Acaryochloris thomasi RCC1774]